MQIVERGDVLVMFKRAADDQASIEFYRLHDVIELLQPVDGAQ